MSEIFLDIETLRHSDEVVQPWSNVGSFGVSVAITYDTTRGFRTWFESDARDLIRELASFDQVITYNGERFDFRVLGFYGAVDQLYERSFDLCDLVRILNNGFRCSLNQLTRENLGRGKRSFSHPRYKGLGPVELWRIGETGRVSRYCRNDVQLLVDIISHIRVQGFLILRGRRVQLPWDLAMRMNKERARIQPSSIIPPSPRVNWCIRVGLRAGRAMRRVFHFIDRFATFRTPKMF